jgi:thiamine biosynthesis protein ThiS
VRIIVNGRSQEAPDEMTVAELLQQLAAPRFVAVEVNYEVVPRARHHLTALQDGDQIELVTLVGGG